MPINKLNLVETPPTPEIKNPPLEKGGDSISPEYSPAEKSEKSVAEFSEPISPAVSKPADQASLDDTFSIDQEKIKKIEKILEENLADIFFSLSPQEQQNFKKRGEETASGIAKLISKPKVKVKKIVSLIRDWLKTIPGINRFFLEQEAKIKADKIIEQNIINK